MLTFTVLNLHTTNRSVSCTLNKPSLLFSRWFYSLSKRAHSGCVLACFMFLIICSSLCLMFGWVRFERHLCSFAGARYYELSFTIGWPCTTHVKWRQISCYWHSPPSCSTANHCTRKVLFRNLKLPREVFHHSKKISGHIMILLRRCWRGNFILLAVVCTCLNGIVARQKAREHEHNEPSTQSTPRVSPNATTATPTTPEETGLELEQPHQTSGNLTP